MQQTRRKLFALLALVALGVAACGGGGDDSDEATTESTADDGDDTGTTDTTEADAEEEATGICAELPPTEDAAEGATRTAVIAKEYEFFAAEALALGGQQAVSLINEGDEVHELQVVRIAPEETRPLEQIIEESADAPPATITPLAGGVACPGERTVFNVDLSTPGRYAAVCFVPVGTTAETDTSEEPSGPPHATQGMFAEFEVAAAPAG